MSYVDCPAVNNLRCPKRGKAQRNDSGQRQCCRKKGHNGNCVTVFPKTGNHRILHPMDKLPGYPTFEHFSDTFWRGSSVKESFAKAQKLKCNCSYSKSVYCEEI